MSIMRKITALALGAGLALAAAGSALAAGNGKLIAIITPSHDNPFFKAEAERRRGQGEGARLRHAGARP